MRWTTTAPAGPGWYWHRQAAPPGPPRVVRVVAEPIGLVVQSPQSHSDDVGAGRAAAQPGRPAPAPPVWEFKVVLGGTPLGLEAELNRAGTDGWGEVASTLSPGAGQTSGWVILRRPKATAR